MKLKSCFVSIAITMCAVWAPQAFSATSTCYGMYVVDVYHCSTALVVVTKDKGGKTLVDSTGKPITAYQCTGTATKYTGVSANGSTNASKNGAGVATTYAPIPVVPTGAAAGGVSPANPDPRTAILAKGGVIYDSGNNHDRNDENGAARLKTDLEASYCHNDAYKEWNSASKGMCGYALPLTAYSNAVKYGTFTFQGQQPNDFAIITGMNTIWKDATHPKVWNCPSH